MSCCHCQGGEAVFDAKVARKELRHYRRRGPRKTTRLLLDALKAAGVAEQTLLDIGGGIGVIQHELLRAGVTEASGVEASTAYLAAAREEAALQGHADRLRQVLLILLDNALKYTPEGGKVTIGVEVDNRQISVSISDTGIGISPEDAERVFERFYRTRG